MAAKPANPNVIAKIVADIFANDSLEFISFWSFIDIKVKPNAGKIQACTMADYHDCVMAALLILSEDDRTRFDMLCGANGIDTADVACAAISAVDRHNEKTRGSKGEVAVADALRSLKIDFESEKRFPELGMMRFDFYIKKHHAVIEYDGAQHSKPVTFFGGEAGYGQTMIRDAIKNKYCQSAGMSILRISDGENVPEAVNKFIHGLH